MDRRGEEEEEAKLVGQPREVNPAGEKHGVLRTCAMPPGRTVQKSMYPRSDAEPERLFPSPLVSFDGGV